MFGAIDPSSGTAVMMEISRVMGQLVKSGLPTIGTLSFPFNDGNNINSRFTLRFLYINCAVNKLFEICNWNSST